jgi:hypothetical protein
MFRLNICSTLKCIAFWVFFQLGNDSLAALHSVLLKITMNESSQSFYIIKRKKERKEASQNVTLPITTDRIADA